MTPILENAVLSTDLDGRFNDLLNINALVPVPSNLATSDHGGLTDSRPPLPGSILDIHVNAAAAIVQSKLLLNGSIPIAWVGISSTTAARGDLAEYLSNKNQPNGYAGLDGSGKVPAAQLPGTTGTGTVTSVGLAMPVQFTVSGSPITGAGTLSAGWAGISDQSWFGNKSGSLAPPQFYSTTLPASLIPSLDASIVTSGVFGAALLPVAVGLGISHAPGAAPDPGDGSTGAATDYLARDMSYKAKPSISLPYQPTLANPTLSVPPFATGNIPVTPSHPVKGVTFFYSLTSSSTGFNELPPAGNVVVTSPGDIWVYAARPGYNNSGIVTLHV